MYRYIRIHRKNFFSRWLLVSISIIIQPGLLVFYLCAGNSFEPDPDRNNDGVVNTLDVSIVSSCLGFVPRIVPGCLRADVDCDGDVDMDDLQFVAAAF